MKVMLLFPPNWTPTMPHLALPTLTAYLRERGVEVIQRDLNIEVFDAILTRHYMQQAIARLRHEYGPKATKHPNREQLPPREQVLWALQEGPALAKDVERAADVVRSDTFFEGDAGMEAFKKVAQCLEIASLPFYPASLHLQSYASAYPVDDSLNLLKAVQDEQTNIFLDIYRQGILADIKREKPDIVGISIPSMAQVLAGMTLGYLIKDAGLSCHITVGGPHISMLRDSLPHVPVIFNLFDSAIIFDGEVPLWQLSQALAGDGDLSGIANFIYKDGDKIRVNERKTPEKITDLPAPDFNGFPLTRYLAPKLVLPLLTARGCYFGKCAFCNVGYGEPETFSQLRAENLVAQMLELRQKYGAEHIFFADEAITPRNLRDMSALLAEHDTPIDWCGCMRFEKVISQELLENMHNGGCRMILFGLESASQAIIDHMVKGTQLDQMSRILQESAAAGIWNHTFMFFGFPGETLEQAQESVNFLFGHGPYINSASVGTFLLERYSPAHQFPQTYSIKRILHQPDKDLAIYYDYEVESGLDADKAELVSSRFIDALPDKLYPQFYVSDAYRFLYASRLSRQNQAMPGWLPKPKST